MTQNACAAACIPCVDEEVCESMSDAGFVFAGDVCDSDCAGFEPLTDENLAMIIFQDQVYRAGFCPGEALQKGTLFPELSRPYTGRGC